LLKEHKIGGRSYYSWLLFFQAVFKREINQQAKTRYC
jgi:hypothetical protein